MNTVNSSISERLLYNNKDVCCVTHKDWKSTTDNNEYQIKQVNFKTYERILKNMIEECKQKYYFDAFSVQKNDIKKHGLQ